MARTRHLGLTLIEMLVSVSLLAIMAAVVVPNVSFNDSTRLAVASQQVGNALRFARSEAIRTGQNVLVDAETSPGRLLLLQRGCSSATSPAVLDPQTRRPYQIDVTDGAFSGGVAMTPRFMVAGAPWSGLVFDASGAAAQACSVATRTPRGVPEAGSGIDLMQAGKLVKLQIDPPTGRVTGL